MFRSLLVFVVLAVAFSFSPMKINRIVSARSQGLSMANIVEVAIGAKTFNTLVGKFIQ